MKKVLLQKREEPRLNPLSREAQERHRDMLLDVIQGNDVRLKIILQPREDKRMNPLSREGF